MVISPRSILTGFKELEGCGQGHELNVNSIYENAVAWILQKRADSNDIFIQNETYQPTKWGSKWDISTNQMRENTMRAETK